MASLIRSVDEDTFDEDVGKISNLILLDFTAPWCGPCKAMMPALEEIAEDYADKVSVLKVDLDESPDIADRFNVQMVPTIIFLKDQKQVKRLNGAKSYDAIVQEVDALLAG